MGMGLESHTHELSNEPKIIFFGLVLTGKPAGLTGRGTAGTGMGKAFVTRGLPTLFTSYRLPSDFISSPIRIRVST